jgi:alkanesulfonate monooxygenase SsuD/methylene tetrahydromethanopterin reductase-like flavin-dependent oxidoreductase (luciferase family)
MTFQLGVYSFGNTPPAADAGPGNTAQAIRDVLEAVQVAEQAGLDFFGFGEHHTPSMPMPSPPRWSTPQPPNGSGWQTAVTVLSTDDPLRVFEQLATAAATAPGRIEALAGRGSSEITFGLFDPDVRHYDMLHSSKLDLLGALTGHLRVGDTKSAAAPAVPLLLSIAVLVLRLMTVWATLSSLRPVTQ